MLFSVPVQRYVVNLGEEVWVDEDGIRNDGAWWTSSPAARSVAELNPDLSLALLGDPGVGKSTTIARLTGEGPGVNYVPLGEVADVATLKNLLNRTVSAPTAEGRPTLVLDGLDESPLAAKPLARQILDAVTARPDIRVVVGCRTGDWPTSLGEELHAALGSFEVVELLPLSLEDIVALASSRGVDGAAFVDTVRAASAGPLAALPLTLDLLLNLYSPEAGLPTEARDLYERGLLLLAREPDQDRADQRKPAGSDAERLAVATRIAAALMLCGRSAVAVEGLAGDTDLMAGELAGGTEPLPAGEFAVRPDVVEGTLATALFSGRGRRRFGIGHASFGAYLTARYVQTHKLAEHQLRALLTTTSSLGRTSVPTRFRETVAWLVALDPERNEWLVALDPAAVVAHSALVSNHRVREALVDFLLEVGDPDRAIPRRRWRLTHPRLAEQLRPPLVAPLTEDAGPHFGHPVSRRAHTAIDIARASGADAVVPEIAALVRCTDLNPYLRSSAAHGLAELDSTRAVEVLRDVLDQVTEHPDQDPEDELRGIALAGCWPQALTIPELLRVLTPPQRPNYFGSYSFFLRQMMEKLSDQAVEQLVQEVAVPAIGGLQEGEDVGWFDEDDLGPATSLLLGSRRDERLMTELLERVLDSPRLEACIDEAGSLLAQAIRHHHGVTLPPRFTRGTGSPEAEGRRELRHKLILAALPHLSPGLSRLLAWRWRLPKPTVPGEPPEARAGLVGSDDLAWLFTLAGGPYSEHARALIGTVFDHEDLLQHDVVWDHRDNPLFAGSIGHWFEPVDVAGGAAERMRQEHAWMNREPSWEGAEGHPGEIAEAWARCRDGDPAAFLDLCLRLRTDPRTGRFDAIDDNLDGWPSFHLLNAHPDELALAARAYLAADGVLSGDWPDAGTITHGALQGYAAMALFARRSDSQAWFDELPDEVWARWAPAIIRCPATGDESSESVKRKLLEEAATRAPNAFTEAYLAWVEQAATAGRSLPSLDPLKAVYDPGSGNRLSALLPPLVDSVNVARHELMTLSSQPDDPAAQTRKSDLVNKLNLARRDAANLADFLCRQGHRPTVAYLKTVLGTPEIPGSAVPEARTVAAIALLLSGAVPWTVVFALVQSAEDFGRALVHELARHRDEDQPTRPLLAEDELASLWRWVSLRWSAETDSLADGFVSDEDQVRHWRDSLLAELAQRATPAALQALSQLATDYSADLRLAGLLREAEARQRDEFWNGPTLSELMGLVTDSRRTVVHDDDDLYRLVLSVLDRIAVRLQHIGQFLWNETRSADDPGKFVWRPKYEPDFSAFIKDHLEQELADGLVVNREVLVRQTTGKGHGLSVDVLASGGSPAEASSRQPTCPIEVKGSWNAGLFTDLEAQLVGDYLPALATKRGVFVCSWFPVDAWDDGADSRRARAAALDRDAATRLLEEAAERASSVDGVQVAAVVIEVPRPIPSDRKKGQSS